MSLRNGFLRCGFAAGLVAACVLGVAASAWATTAYVTNYGSGTVTPIEVATGKPGSEIKVGSGPIGVAVTPDGKTAYVTNYGSGTVTPIEVATNKPGSEIKVGFRPVGVAVTPDGKTAYVTNEGSGTVTPIEVATNKPGSEIKVGSHPYGVAVTPDGKTAYVVNQVSGTVTPIEVATNIPGSEIKVGSFPFGVAITPDGKTAYVANWVSGTVTPIEVATNKPGPEIKVGSEPEGVAITPDGKTAYVANGGSESVTPIEVATNTPGSEIKVGRFPAGVAVTPLPAPTCGKTTIGKVSDALVVNIKRVNKCAVPVSALLTELHVYLEPTNVKGQQLIEGIIYADNKGKPGERLGTSTQLTFKSTEAAGWYSLPFSPPVKLTAGTYWIGTITGNSGKVAAERYDAVKNAEDYNTNIYTSGPSNPFGSFKTTNEEMSLYATFTACPVGPFAVACTV